MTVLLNSFEGGTNGTTISAANSGGSSGNAFDNVSVGLNATLTYDNAHAAHGGLAGKPATTSSSTTSIVVWSTSMGTKTQLWFRMYVYLTANPAAIIGIWRPLNVATQCSMLEITTGGLLRWVNTSSATILTGAVAVPLNQWWRVEGFTLCSATVGQVEYKLFKTADSSSPDETQTSAATQNTSTQITQTQIGLTNNSTSQALWMDDLGLSSTGYIGPVLAGAGAMLASGIT